MFILPLYFSKSRFYFVGNKIGKKLKVTLLFGLLAKNLSFYFFLKKPIRVQGFYKSYLKKISL